MPHIYPLLNVEVRTPKLTLAGASDDMLERLVPVVRDGVVGQGELPFDDPMSLYEDNPQREWKWLRGIWAGRARVDPQWWRFYFVVLVDGHPVGMQDLIGANFAAFGTVSTFSWLRPSFRRRGLGTEMRSAVLHLAFAGLVAREASSEAFADNDASNGVSRTLGYQPNGTAWATRRGDPAPLTVWKLTRKHWERSRRDDIELTGVEACWPVLGLGWLSSESSLPDARRKMPRCPSRLQSPPHRRPKIRSVSATPTRPGSGTTICAVRTTSRPTGRRPRRSMPSCGR